MYDNYESTKSISLSSAGSAPPYEMNAVRDVASVRESEQTEKTLIHLRGRVEELRERLSMVLSPSLPTIAEGSKGADLKDACSPLTDRMRGFRRVANDSITMVEDILNRLDV